MALTLRTLSNGDTNYIGKHNSNYADVQTAVNALETTSEALANKNQPDGYAGLDGDGQVPPGVLGAAQLKNERGAANGYASLDATGKIPPAQLPYITVDGTLVDMASFEVTSRKGAANGYCGLDAGSKVPVAQLPTTVELTTRKGAANGYASLDSGGKVPEAQLPTIPAGQVADLSATYQAKAEKGAANGYATLDSGGHVPAAQLPTLTQPVLQAAFYPGAPGPSALLLAFLPTVAVEIPAALAGSRCKVGTNPTATVTLKVKKNGADVGTIAISTSGAITLTAASAISLTTEDELTVVAPVVADATLADVRLTIHGTR